jgi:hypothetical protein
VRDDFLGVLLHQLRIAPGSNAVQSGEIGISSCKSSSKDATARQGRDDQGVTERVSPRVFRVVALPAPKR